MPLSSGTKLGPYEILARVGAGRMGEVYALRLNTPSLFWTHELLARIYAHLGNRAAASAALKDLAALRPDFFAKARREYERFFVETSFIDQMLDGLRQTGLEIAGEESAAATGPKSTPDPAKAPAP